MIEIKITMKDIERFPRPTSRLPCRFPLTAQGSDGQMGRWTVRTADQGPQQLAGSQVYQFVYCTHSLLSSSCH